MLAVPAKRRKSGDGKASNGRKAVKLEQEHTTVPDEVKMITDWFRV